MSELKEKQFNHIANLIYQQCGITLNHSKKTMVETRLVRRLRDLQLDDFDKYLQYLDDNPKELEPFINALTTNLTHFFRESAHFDFLHQVVFPEIRKKNRNKKIRAWSAASSTGEEVYTIAMCLHEEFGDALEWDYKVLGTDIDTSVLARAEQGIYKLSDIKELAPHLGRKYFERGTGNNSNRVRIKKFLKDNTKFRQFNLVRDSFPVDIAFDFIFLRNVLIYFDEQMIAAAIKRIEHYLKPGGYLFIGHSETLSSVKHRFKAVSSSIYKNIG